MYMHIYIYIYIYIPLGGGCLWGRWCHLAPSGAEIPPSKELTSMADPNMVPHGRHLLCFAFDMCNPLRLLITPPLPQFQLPPPVHRCWVIAGWPGAPVRGHRWVARLGWGPGPK